MRLTHLAVSKYMDTVTITMSLTHFWAVSGGEIADVETGTLMDPSIPKPGEYQVQRQYLRAPILLRVFAETVLKAGRPNDIIGKWRRRYK